MYIYFIKFIGFCLTNNKLNKTVLMGYKELLLHETFNGERFYIPINLLLHFIIAHSLMMLRQKHLWFRTLTGHQRTTSTLERFLKFISSIASIKSRCFHSSWLLFTCIVLFGDLSWLLFTIMSIVIGLSHYFTNICLHQRIVSWLFSGR